MILPLDIYEAYQQYIFKVIDLPLEELTFKSHPTYKHIVETVSPKAGLDYLHYVKSEYNDLYIQHKELLVDICYKNDSIGNPNKIEFHDFCECSPTSMRYLYHAFTILSYMKSNNIVETDIIEIGGGYGGLCLFTPMNI